MDVDDATSGRNAGKLKQSHTCECHYRRESRSDTRMFCATLLLLSMSVGRMLRVVSRSRRACWVGMHSYSCLTKASKCVFMNDVSWHYSFQEINQ